MRNVYCSNHRLPETHNCSFNYKLNQSEIHKIQEEMKCVNQKLLKI
jgi:hypothetical protein